MNILDIAQQDLEFTMKDLAGGFGYECIITDENGVVYPAFTGKFNYRGFEIDPDTGQLVAGSEVEIDLKLSDIITATGQKPRKNWLLEITNKITGYTHNYAVIEPLIDEILGIAKLRLGAHDIT